jgi:plasmid stabilization system protein ParE
MTTRQWRIRLGAAAEADFAHILAWTVDNFGAQQAAIYRDILVQAISELANGPMFQEQERVTTSCPAFVHSTLPGAVGTAATSSCIA